MKDNYRLALKYNNVGTRENCSICGNSFKADIPLALFLENSQNAVCDQCAKKYGSDLYTLLDFYYRKSKIVVDY
jgi:ribosome-binding protein aMBF1 (putative translation factor)